MYVILVVKESGMTIGLPRYFQGLLYEIPACAVEVFCEDFLMSRDHLFLCSFTCLSFYRRSSVWIPTPCNHDFACLSVSEKSCYDC